MRAGRVAVAAAVLFTAACGSGSGPSDSSPANPISTTAGGSVPAVQSETATGAATGAATETSSSKPPASGKDVCTLISNQQVVSVLGGSATSAPAGPASDDGSTLCQVSLTGSAFGDGSAVLVQRTTYDDAHWQDFKRQYQAVSGVPDEALYVPGLTMLYLRRHGIVAVITAAGVDSAVPAATIQADLTKLAVIVSGQLP